MLEEAGDLVLQSNVVNNLGIEAYYAGRWDEASELYRQSGELSERVGDVVNVARAQNNEGEIVSDQGKLDEAEALFLEARRVWRAARYPVGIALATSNLGRVAARTGRFDEALELLAEALTAFEALGSNAFGHETQARRVESFVLAGRYQDALEVAPTVLEAAGDNRLLYPFLERLHGYALVQARRQDEARPRFERSLELARELEADYEVALTLEALGLTRLGDPDAGGREQGDPRAPRRRLDATCAAALRKKRCPRHESNMRTRFRNQLAETPVAGKAGLLATCAPENAPAL